MKRKGWRLQDILESHPGGHSVDGASLESGHFCFSCEQVFESRLGLEEHLCSSVGFICSCGTEFGDYKAMKKHSGTHEPGRQALDHDTIKKRRMERIREEEEKLKRLQNDQGAWKSSEKSKTLPFTTQKKSIMQTPNSLGFLAQKPIQTAHISQVPQLIPQSKPHPPLPVNMRNLFGDTGAPTVELWTLYQPVVLIEKVQNTLMDKPYSCGKCGQGFTSKVSLITHHSSHVTDKVSGCIGCGLLLSSKKVVPRFHTCNSSKAPAKFRLITAKPLNHRGPGDVASQLKMLPQHSAVSSENKNPIAVTSSLKNSSVHPYNATGRLLPATPPLQSKNQNHGTLKPPVGLAFPPLSQSLNFSNKTAAPALMSNVVDLCDPNDFKCRVCQIVFETPQLLQRHKCARAHEFMANHMRGSKGPQKLGGVPPKTPGMSQVNGERKLAFPKSPLLTVGLDKGNGKVPINVELDGDADDDCYIVEVGPADPAEVIYQVTSSVPIKI